MVINNINKLNYISNGNVNLLFIDKKDVTSNQDLSDEIGLSVEEIQEVFRLYDCIFVEDDYVIPDGHKDTDKIIEMIKDLAIQKQSQIEQCRSTIKHLENKNISVEIIHKDEYIVNQVLMNVKIDIYNYNVVLSSENNQKVEFKLSKVNKFEKEVNKQKLTFDNDLVMNIYFCIKLI